MGYKCTPEEIHGIFHIVLHLIIVIHSVLIETRDFRFFISLSNKFIKKIHFKSAKKFYSTRIFCTPLSFRNVPHTHTCCTKRNTVLTFCLSFADTNNSAGECLPQFLSHPRQQVGPLRQPSIPSHSQYSSVGERNFAGAAE